MDVCRSYSLVHMDVSIAANGGFDVTRCGGS